VSRESAIAWSLAAAVLVAAPWVFTSGFALSLLCQIGILVVFALSYNMLLGQTGLLSFGHAVYYGLGALFAIHALNLYKVPAPFVPLVGGAAGLAFGVVFGFVTTRRAGTTFSMITLGVGEMVAACSLMFPAFFGGEAGISGNRSAAGAWLGLTFGPQVQVYYVVAAWLFASAAAMYALTRTPLGRMANACRDNFERAQFVGYDPRMVRFFQFALSGFFAGIAGALYTLTYEIVTYDTVAGPMSANALLMTYIGGVGVFAGPVVGAVLIVLLQSWVSLLSNSWLVYAGVLFIMMVTFAPGGLAGLVLAHQPIWRTGRLRRLAGPYLRLLGPALLVTLGFVLAVELCSFLTIGAAQGKRFVIGRLTIDPRGAMAWAVAGALLAGGGLWLRHAIRGFAAAWNAVSEDVKSVGLSG
jgi:branched-chain amino acid transport system permease protein